LKNEKDTMKRVFFLVTFWPRFVCASCLHNGACIIECNFTLAIMELNAFICGGLPSDKWTLYAGRAQVREKALGLFGQFCRASFWRLSCHYL